MADQLNSIGISIYCKIIYKHISLDLRVPSIAQLVERRTVVLMKSSLGRWFESGSKEIFLFSDDNFTSYSSFISLRDR